MSDDPYSPGGLARKAREFARLPAMQLILRRGELMALLEELAVVVGLQEDLLRAAADRLEEVKREGGELRIASNRMIPRIEMDGQAYLPFASIEPDRRKPAYLRIVARWPGESGGGAAVYVTPWFLKDLPNSDALWAVLMNRLRDAYVKGYEEFLKESDEAILVPDYRDLRLTDPAKDPPPVEEGGMRPGTVIRLPDGRIGTICYNNLDGEGGVWGRFNPAGIPLGFNDQWPEPDFLLREKEVEEIIQKRWGGKKKIECVGTEFEILWEPE